MPHQDAANLCTNVDTLKAAFAELLSTDLDDVTRHGNAPLAGDGRHRLLGLDGSGHAG